MSDGLRGGDPIPVAIVGLLAIVTVAIVLAVRANGRRKAIRLARELHLRLTTSWP